MIHIGTPSAVVLFYFFSTKHTLLESIKSIHSVYDTFSFVRSKVVGQVAWHARRRALQVIALNRCCCIGVFPLAPRRPLSSSPVHHIGTQDVVERGGPVFSTCAHILDPLAIPHLINTIIVLPAADKYVGIINRVGKSWIVEIVVMW